MSEVPIDDLVELIGDLDAAMYTQGVVGNIVKVKAHFVAPVFDDKARIMSEEEGFVEDEQLLPWGVTLSGVVKTTLLKLRFKNPNEKPDPNEWAFVDVRPWRVEEDVSEGLYDALDRIVRDSGLIPNLTLLSEEIGIRLKAKPALQSAVLNKLERRRRVIEGVQSEAEKKAVQDFYDKNDYGVF